MLEDEADAQKDTQSNSLVLPRVIDFLDHFDECLQVVVNCARKTEVTRWEFLFDIVGKPRDLFEVSWRNACESSLADPTFARRNVSLPAFSRSRRPTFSSCTTSSPSSRVAR